jgi:hypothetical protein
MDLFRNFSPEQYASALSSWTFIDLTDKTPTFTSSFGDVFFTSPTGYWWLDTLEGRLEQPWPNHKAMEAELKTDEGLDHYLSGSLCHWRGSGRSHPKWGSGLRMANRARHRWPIRTGEHRSRRFCRIH